jgi:hypothetical protein
MRVKYPVNIAGQTMALWWPHTQIGKVAKAVEYAQTIT